MRASWFLSVLAVAAVTHLGVGCRDMTRPDVNPALVAGTYVLAAVSGRGPMTGTMVLTAIGGAERRAQYAGSSGALGPAYVAVGTFRAQPDSISFTLREDDGRSPYVWGLRGERLADGFIIRYADPADGPDIVETYRRQ